MNVIAYIRVSTEEQASGGVSLDAQRAKIEAYAALYDLQVVEVVVDAGVSAKTLNRPGLQACLAMMKAGKADGVVVAKLDRLSRSVADWNLLIDRYFGEKPGKQLLSVADQIDTRTAAGRLVLNVLMSVAQWERETIGERTRDAMAHKRARRERVGSVPFGFDLADDGATLVPNDAEQRVIADIRALRAEGHSLRRITDELTGQGIATKEGNTRWTHTAIAKILGRAA
jgi:DNA invertase Pin-like site-specific DNA recombinase